MMENTTATTHGYICVDDTSKPKMHELHGWIDMRAYRNVAREKDTRELL